MNFMTTQLQEKVREKIANVSALQESDPVVAERMRNLNLGFRIGAASSEEDDNEDEDEDLEDGEYELDDGTEQ